jgi:outer membrane lipoprotein-sorting protein
MTRLLTIALALAAPLAAQSLAETFAHMDKTALKLDAVAADIRHDVHTAIINDDEVDTGIFRLKREKSHGVRMLIDFVGKNAKTVSLDDATVSVYYPKSNVEQIFDIGPKKQVVQQFLLLGFGATSTELKQSYDVTWVGAETIDGQQTGHIKLIPKSQEALRQMTSAELWISDTNGLPLQQKIVLPSGDYWLVNYSKIQLNSSLSSEALKIKLPKGVKVEHPVF